MSTWFPDLFQHCHIQAELVDDKIVCIVLEPFETEPLIPPVLPEIAVHGIELVQPFSMSIFLLFEFYHFHFRYWTH